MKFIKLLLWIIPAVIASALAGYLLRLDSTASAIPTASPAIAPQFGIGGQRPAHVELIAWFVDDKRKNLYGIWLATHQAAFDATPPGLVWRGLSPDEPLADASFSTFGQWYHDSNPQMPESRYGYLTNVLYAAGNQPDAIVQLEFTPSHVAAWIDRLGGITLAGQRINGQNYLAWHAAMLAEPSTDSLLFQKDVLLAVCAAIQTQAAQRQLTPDILAGWMDNQVVNAEPDFAPRDWFEYVLETPADLARLTCEAEALLPTPP